VTRSSFEETQTVFKKKSLLAVVALMLAFSSFSFAVKTKAADPVTIRWRTRVDSADEQKVYQTISDKISEQLKDKGITLKYEPQPVDGYFENLKTQLASGTAPDVFWIAGAFVASYATGGAILDLKDIAAADKDFSVKDFYAAPMTELTHGGSLWGLPRDVGPLVVYYNEDLFTQAGLDTPAKLSADGKWDWAAFNKAAAALTDEKAGTYGFGHDNWWGPWGYWIYAGGGSLFNADNTACNLNSEGSIKGLQALQDAYTKTKTSPLPGSPSSGQALWLAGKEGMFFNGRWFTPAARGAAFKWGVAEMPKGPGGNFTWGFWGAYTINAKTAHAKEAWEVVKALTSADNQGAIAALGTNIPSRNSKAAQDAFLKSTPPADNTPFIKSLDYAKGEFALWGGDLDEILNQVIQPQLDKVWQGTLSPADFGKTVCPLVDAKLKK
jgi:multiple sugar transport system substrate-binding protein